MLKKTLFSLFAFAVVVSAFAGVKPAKAASIGDVIMCPGFTSVYYWAEDGNRYVFPNIKTYHSWYSDFDSLSMISCADMMDLTLGGMVDYQPGSRLVKLTTWPVVYFVSPFGDLRPIADEDQALDLFGPTWALEIDDVPDVFFTQYTIGDEIADGELPAGMFMEDDDGVIYRVDYDGNILNIDDLLTEDQKDVIEDRAEDLEDVESRMGTTFTLVAAADRTSDQTDEQELWLEVIPITDEEAVSDDEMDDEVEEIDEGTLPDFTVEDIYITGSNNLLQAVVSNIGTGDAPTDDFGVYYWFDDELEWTYSVSTWSDQSILTAGGSSVGGPQTLSEDTTVKVCVDPNGVVEESDETNNCLTVDIDIADDSEEVDEVNLTAMHPLMEESGLLHFYVQNTGNVDIDEFQAYIYINGELEWTYSSSTLSDQDALTAGGTTSISPQVLTESADVEICIDPNNMIEESDETDNCSSASYTIEPEEESYTDLSVTSVELSDSDQIIAYVENTGTEDVDQFYTYFWINDVLEWTYSSSTLSDQDALSSGGVTQISPQVLTENATVKVCVDPNNAIEEIDEDNDCVTEEFVVEDYTDLSVTDVSLSSTDLLTATIENTGTQDVESFSVYIWYNDSLRWTYSSSTLGDTDALSSGGVTSISPQYLSEDTEVEVCVDPNDTIEESDEDNNCVTVDLEV